MGSLFVGSRIFRRSIGFIKDEVAGVIGRLQYIEPTVAGLLDGSFVVEPCGGNKVIDVSGVYLNMNQGNVHSGAFINYECVGYYTSGYVVSGF
jgi:hypothetical protein